MYRDKHMVVVEARGMEKFYGFRFLPHPALTRWERVFMESIDSKLLARQCFPDHGR